MKARSAITLAAASLILLACNSAPEADRPEPDRPEVSVAPVANLPDTANAKPAPGEEVDNISGKEPGELAIVIGVDELTQMRDQGAIRLIDVRTEEEIAQGMIPGAEHIALDQFDPAALDPGDTREVVFYCRSGRRSAVAAERLARYRGKPVKHLAGGYIAWSESEAR